MWGQLYCKDRKVTSCIQYKKENEEKKEKKEKKEEEEKSVDQMPPAEDNDEAGRRSEQVGDREWVD